MIHLDVQDIDQRGCEFVANLLIASKMISVADDRQLDFLKITPEQRDALCNKNIVLKNKQCFTEADSHIAAFHPQESRKEDASVISYNRKNLPDSSSLDLSFAAHELRHAIDFWQQEQKPKPKHSTLQKCGYTTAALALWPFYNLINNAATYTQELVAFDFGERFLPWEVPEKMVCEKVSFKDRMKEMFLTGYPSDRTRTEIWAETANELMDKPHPLYKGHLHTIPSICHSITAHQNQ